MLLSKIDIEEDHIVSLSISAQVVSGVIVKLVFVVTYGTAEGTSHSLPAYCLS
jgi:hypothetical protein